MRTSELRLVLIVLILAGNFVLRLPFFSIPLERDEGEYAYIAQVISDGGVPYRDAFNQKPPATFYLYALIFALFGPSAAALRVAAAMYHLIAVFFVYRIGRRMKGIDAGLIAALIFTVISSERRLLGFSANTELFMLAPLCAAVDAVLAYLERQRLRSLVAAGFLFGLATLFKQPAAIVGAAMTAGVVIIRVQHREQAVVLARDTAAVLAAFAAPLVLTALLFAGAGAGSDFLYQVFLHNIDYVSRKVSVADGLANVTASLRFIAQSQAAIWVAAVLGIGVMFRATPKEITLPLLAWLFSAAAGVTLGHRYTLHYFMLITPPLALCAAAGTCALFRIPDGRERRCAAGRTLAAVLAAVIALPAYANAPYFACHIDDMPAIIYADNPLTEARCAARHISERTRPGDAVFIVGSEPQILFYARRRSASKYIFLYPLTENYPDSSRRQREVIGDVARSLPGYIVFVNYNLSLGATDATDPYLFASINRLLDEHYLIDGIVTRQRPRQVIAGDELGRLIDRDPGLFASEAIFLYRRKELRPDGTPLKQL